MLWDIAMNLYLYIVNPSEMLAVMGSHFHADSYYRKNGAGKSRSKDDGPNDSYPYSGEQEVNLQPNRRRRSRRRRWR